MKNLLKYLLGLVVLISGCSEEIALPATVTDIDENVYKTVTIGGQTWMAENLRTTHYADGTKIPYHIDTVKWRTSIPIGVRAFCFYGNDFENSKTKGALYNFVAATNGSVASSTNPKIQGVCPTGWHIPTSAEWYQLRDTLAALGTAGFEGDALKSIDGWGQQDLTDPFEFNAIPSGMLMVSYTRYQFIDSLSHWWTATQSSDYNAISYRIEAGRPSIYGDYSAFKPWALSVRCVKD